MSESIELKEELESLTTLAKRASELLKRDGYCPSILSRILIKSMHKVEKKINNFNKPKTNNGEQQINGAGEGRNTTA